MQPLACERCGACVQVQKHSWEHTAVQWNEAAQQSCREIHSWEGREGRPGAPVMRCESLTASIHTAAVEGRLAVTDEDPVPTPQIADH
ncbi:hypothetical protein SAMN05444580_10310 [Rhodococcus tukisamuensis]|uniref:Ferredoxin n=1 Tax=Rhodococcus tukisamuensis TaxID=168276 RepID=A0A1G6S5G5_9NOCA|nr:hypothetical protein [Rhodococcus tukisamuensis]SDD11933.1 hypothetical protein SAMN05444580_10310 [Rhodococcus tukisamuensis]